MKLYESKLYEMLLSRNKIGFNMIMLTNQDLENLTYAIRITDALVQNYTEIRVLPTLYILLLLLYNINLLNIGIDRFFLISFLG